VEPVPARTGHGPHRRRRRRRQGRPGSGYGGHYFWDSEVYVLPFLSYTTPIVARNVLRFRQRMLDAARAGRSS
jgi:trehalose/maltose hydrolase-like predicted phosphorylase